MTLTLMETKAWHALPLRAQALYPWVRLEWKGKKLNNNGEISLSCRQAAEKMGVALNTAASAFRDLQAKGFLVVTKVSHLGTEGKARLQFYEITELEMPKKDVGRHLYKSWQSGKDFKIISPVKTKPRRKI